MERLPVYLFATTSKTLKAEHLLLVNDVKLDETFRVVPVNWSTVNEPKFLTINKMFRNEPPACIITAGSPFRDFPELQKFHFEIRKIWLDAEHGVKTLPQYAVNNCLLETVTHSHAGQSDWPLLSVVITAYKSGARILRPWNSLLQSTYTNWEAIFVDDDPPKPKETKEDNDTDNDSNWLQICKFVEQDIRVSAIRASHHSGYIGQVKRLGFSAAKGKWIIEVDHDDVFDIHLLQWIVDATKQHPSAGFVYSDCIELLEDGDRSFHYNDDTFGRGYGSYVKQLYKGQWHNVLQGINQNPTTVRHIVSMPNHVRAWRKDVYERIGRHCEQLSVVDDYELMLRTFLDAKIQWLHIAELGYMQYRNADGNNMTLKRNKLIQNLVRLVSHRYDEQLEARFDLIEGDDDKMPDDETLDYMVAYEQYPRFGITWRQGQDEIISIVTPTFKRPELLRAAIRSVQSQTYPKWELLIIGDHCPDLEKLMNEPDMMTDPRVKYWNLLSKNHGAGGAVPRNYAVKKLVNTKYCAFLNDDNTWEPNHLQSLWDAIHSHPSIRFAFSSLKMDGQIIYFNGPKIRRGRIDTSCVLFETSLARQYDYWKSRDQAGYAHDFEYFSRWRKEAFACTMLPTLNYSCAASGQNPQQILKMYNDQTRCVPGIIQQHGLRRSRAETAQIFIYALWALIIAIWSWTYLTAVR